jgi:hypothetical protein
VRFCSLEGGNFPETEFEVDPHWGIVHNTIHPHTTAGTYLKKPEHRTPVEGVPARVG